jgi:hypothetical protein
LNPTIAEAGFESAIPVIVEVRIKLTAKLIQDADTCGELQSGRLCWFLAGDRPLFCARKTGQARIAHGEPRGELNDQIRAVFVGRCVEREIRKLGEFAFRGKHSKGEASRRFVEEFVKEKQSRCVDEEREETQGFEEGKNANYKGGNEKMQECIWPSPESPLKPKYPHGTCIEHLYSHSWSNPGGV